MQGLGLDPAQHDLTAVPVSRCIAHMSTPARIRPAVVSFDARGTPRSDEFDDVYHSADGARAQARHVFLGGNGLPHRWRGRRSFTIIETGFGLGVNFLATWEALRADPSAPQRLHYVSAEQHPPSAEMLAALHRKLGTDPTLVQALLERWPPIVRGFHRLGLDRGRVSLTLLLGDAAELLAELDACADALYLDGFAPVKNPYMWSEALIRELGRLSQAGTTAATWTVAAEVRARLIAAGFRIEIRPGFGRKREMLCAEKMSVALAGSLPTAPERHAVVIGAGLAGTWCAHALARRGWRVDLLERERRPAQKASGIAVGALRPVLNLADNNNARLGRAAFLTALDQLALYPELGACWARTGVLHVATRDAQVSRMARIVARHAFPPDYVEHIGARTAAERAGHAIARPAWWIPGGGWIDPRALCEALLRLHAGRIVASFGVEAAEIVPRAGEWQVLAHNGRTLAQAPTVIFATAHEVGRVANIDAPPLVSVRGQVSHLPAAAARQLEIVVCGDGYVAPHPEGGHCVGASFHPGDSDTEIRDADHAENLARLERVLPGFAAGLDPCTLAGWAALRTATADRLPACGTVGADSVQHAPDLQLIAGLGARGLIWAPLCAELVAARLEGEPWPVERALAAALAPSRLRMRGSRTNRRMSG
jgi:tRNA 5-methylaminomethyl-2-thiouridine biosynthesis bifunctional protein